jgi:hypothetical protein
MSPDVTIGTGCNGAAAWMRKPSLPVVSVPRSPFFDDRRVSRSMGSVSVHTELRDTPLLMMQLEPNLGPFSQSCTNATMHVRAHLIGTDTDYLEQLHMRMLFKANALNAAENLLFEMPPLASNAASPDIAAQPATPTAAMSSADTPNHICLGWAARFLNLGRSTQMGMSTAIAMRPRLCLAAVVSLGHETPETGRWHMLYRKGCIMFDSE